MAEEYLRFLNLLKAVDGPLRQTMDAGCTKLLETICIEAFLHKRYYNVNELIGMRDLGSQASIHKRLHTLVDKGYATLETQNDARIKKVIPTKDAKKLFVQLNKVMLSVIKESN
jgi:hypothetical protein